MLSAQNLINSPQFNLHIDPLNLKIIETLTKFQATLKIYGYNIEVYTAASLAKLNQLPAEKKLQIITTFENWNLWISPKGERINEIDYYDEREFIAKALAHYNSYVEDEFWTALDDKQVVEIYSPDIDSNVSQHELFCFHFLFAIRSSRS